MDTVARFFVFLLICFQCCLRFNTEIENVDNFGEGKEGNEEKRRSGKVEERDLWCLITFDLVLVLES